MAVVVLPDAGDGDIILALPCVEALAERETVYLVAGNHRVSPLIAWTDRIQRPVYVPHGMEMAVPLSIVPAAQKWGKNIHPTQLYFLQVGLPQPAEVPQPKVTIDGEAGAWDFIIAPWSHDPARSLSNEQSYHLIDMLNQTYPGSSFCIIGSTDSPQTHVPGVNLTEYYGQRYMSIGRMMLNARKAVITVDSAPSRLAHAVGCTKHVLLCSEVVPEQWGTWPGARLLYGRDTFTDANVCAMIDR